MTIFLLDCCRTYHLPKSDANPRANDPSGLTAMVANVGSLIAFACAPGTIADDAKGQRNGLFTKYLLKHIPTPNEDIRMVLTDVTDEVMNESKSKQIPSLSVALRQKNIFLCEQLSSEYQRFKSSEKECNK